MVVSSGRSFETVSIGRSLGASERPYQRSLPLLPDDSNETGRSVVRATAVPVAGLQEVPGQVGAVEAAARKPRIRKPIELPGQGCGPEVAGAGPEPSRQPRP